MLAIPEKFRLELNPVATLDAVLRVGCARFTILTDRLIRLEYDPAGVFEDRASQTFWYRQQPVPAFTVNTDPIGIEIETDSLLLRYTENSTGFTPETLSIRLKSTGAVWRPGDSDSQNLKGTTRTLDFVNGSTPLGSGLVSRSGWSLVDDSTTLVRSTASTARPSSKRPTSRTSRSPTARTPTW